MIPGYVAIAVAALLVLTVAEMGTYRPVGIAAFSGSTAVAVASIYTWKSPETLPQTIAVYAFIWAVMAWFVGYGLAYYEEFHGGDGGHGGGGDGGPWDGRPDVPPPPGMSEKLPSAETTEVSASAVLFFGADRFDGLEDIAHADAGLIEPI